MSHNFNVVEQAEKIVDVLSKGINGYVVVSVDVTIGGDWDTHPIIVTIHSYDNHDITHVIVITAFSTQKSGLETAQRWNAPNVEGIEMGNPDGPARVRNAYHKLTKHLEKEGFGVYESCKEFFN